MLTRQGMRSMKLVEIYIKAHNTNPITQSLDNYLSNIISEIYNKLTQKFGAKFLYEIN